MNLKILSVLGVMAFMVGAWFFYKEDVNIEPAVPSAPAVSYEVTEIKAVQTSPETGEIEYTLTADSLAKNSAGVDEMKNAKMDWTPPNSETYHLEASLASLGQTTGDLLLKEGFVLVRQGDDTKPDMTIKGNLLTGNTKQRQVASSEPISVTQGVDSFMAQGFTGDLQTGEYEFYRIQMEFAPPKREDKPLF
ncbi:LPS export ABC transporter periplasmic protein LptC [Moraxella bovis]|uniref:LPS export ABC transporter periplasmic protein LptC n=1 Tax=Moraxella bovis TaxID=476 RepID=UPI0022263D22|nr:LPS export ABC transporter periplasmic protein LptC [Moraxella bovis]UYZ67495.1 LPS export ABC transporter periplasmic protein LptC [Moraxella bovis]UYZ69856.1 LPS export ABC transporter periplasmic protein LptC [Moraxella bovis]UYZ74223.1 LPS export ABC transporter periplasmic protein LptC [Moraxella bovis]UZA13139.1 LPS export ABC transporter periplasmic protein LptC [Moraxella bovis]UZA28522.1 LPS export ABC transporter periplasmic protein LptC [Moraxella bovis]